MERSGVVTGKWRNLLLSDAQKLFLLYFIISYSYYYYLFISFICEQRDEYRSSIGGGDF